MNLPQILTSPERHKNVTTLQSGRVAVYLDFDNIVLSWYDRVHGRNSYARDRQRITEEPSEPEIAARLQAAVIDVGAIIDYASSFGTLVLTRAYADWSSPVNAEYRSQLVARAVDLVQLFPAAAYAKNGADIRLAVDTVEDMFRLDDLTHVIIVAGDSDYVPLAQRCKRLGRYVAGVGVAGSTAKALTAACDEFTSYDSLPGIERPEDAQGQSAKRQNFAKATPSGGEHRPLESPNQHAPTPLEPVGEAQDAGAEEEHDISVTGLLIRALWLSQDKDDSGWLYSSAVKQHMRRMDPSFSEKALGFRSFSDFLKSRADVVELEESGHERLVRLRDQA